MNRWLATACLPLAGCLTFADGREELEQARLGRARYVHEVGELGDPKVPAGPALTANPDQAIEAIRPWLASPDRDLRLTTVEGLRRLAQRAPSLVKTRFPDLFDPALADADPGVRWRAAWALGRIGLSRPLLRAALLDPVARVAERAAWALGQARDDSAVEPLLAALEREEPVASAAALALERVTGAKLGRDPAAWRGWVDGKNPR